MIISRGVKRAIQGILVSDVNGTLQATPIKNDPLELRVAELEVRVKQLEETVYETKATKKGSGKKRVKSK